MKIIFNCPFILSLFFFLYLSLVIASNSSEESSDKNEDIEIETETETETEPEVEDEVDQTRHVPVAKTGDILKMNIDPNLSELEVSLSSEGEEALKEITESELLRIATENHVYDPLNSFYDPFEPYRIITYAYWNPITNSALHKNPPIPSNFLPPNAPPKSLPADFFFQDSAARQLVLEEHAAAFCPFLRRWREKNPLKPYPIDPDFVNNHPPIKFIPGKGYEIDSELDWLNILSQQATNAFAQKLILEHKIAAAEKSGLIPIPPIDGGDDDDDDDNEEHVAKGNQKEKPKKKTKSKRRAELEVIYLKIEQVRKSRSDCKEFAKFIAPPPQTDYSITSSPHCLLEVIFLLEEHEDRTSPIVRESKIPENVDKVEHYRQILLHLEDGDEFNRLSFTSMISKRGKCPFGFKRGSSSKPKASIIKSPPNSPKNGQIPKFYQGTVPKFAKLERGEVLFSSESDSDYEQATKYLFPYKQVPFPSIQNTLKKYVSI